LNLDTKINDLKQLKEILQNEQASIVYFTSPKCNVCKTLKPKIMELINQNYPKIGKYFVDISENPEIPANFSVFSAPTIIVFLENKEFIRKSRAMSPHQLIEEIKRPYEIMTS
jgi:thioredoxin-like negative regulator of GroEL